MGRDDDLKSMDEATRRLLAQQRDDWQTLVAAARGRFSADSLIGMRISQARTVVEAAGGEFVTADGPIAMKLDSNRLVAEIDGGRVVATSIG